MPGMPLSNQKKICIASSDEQVREDFVCAPEVPTKSQNVWFVSDRTEDRFLEEAFHKARVDLGFDPDDDILWRTGSAAVRHARTVLALYAASAGGNHHSLPEGLLESFGGVDKATLEWRTVGEPVPLEVRSIPGMVQILQTFEVKVSGFREESVVVEGKTYTRKVPIQTDWFEVAPHRFDIHVGPHRVSLVG